MSLAVPPCPDVPARTPALPSAAAQHAGIRELIRIAELQEQAYARDLPGRRPGRPFCLRYAVPGARRPVDAETFSW